MSRLFFPFYTGLVLSLFILMPGCSSLRPKTDPMQDKKAFDIATRTIQTNLDIVTSKGTGWATLNTPEKTEKFKIAWAVRYPAESRMTFLVSGMPVETIAANGKTITFLSHTGKHAKYTYRSKDPDMDRFVQVPVHMSEVVLLLLGRLPLKSFDDAYFSPAQNAFTQITLRNTQTFQTQYLTFDDTHNLSQYTLTNSLGDTTYQLTVLGYKTVQSKQIPSRIEIRDSFHRKLTLEVLNFKVNPVVDDTIFQLTEPG